MDDNKQIDKKPEAVYVDPLLVNEIVSEWNVVVDECENRLIKFGMWLKQLLDKHPDQDPKQVLKKVVQHPDYKQLLSPDRLYGCWVFINKRPDIVRLAIESSPDQLNNLPDETRPLLKPDGTVAVDMYIELYKRDSRIDDGLKGHLERQAKAEGWSAGRLRQAVSDIINCTPYEEITDDAMRRKLVQVLVKLCNKLTSNDVSKLVMSAEDMIRLRPKIKRIA